MIRKLLISHALFTLVLFAPGVQAAGTEGINTYLGSGAGANLGGLAFSNTFIGLNAGNVITTTDGNTFLGNRAGELSNASENVFIGNRSGVFNTTGTDNTFVGSRSGRDNTEGGFNTFVGKMAGLSNTDGDNNTFLGTLAGQNNSSGSGNVFVGYRAGRNETGSNKLYIESSSSADPLIYGEFDNNIVGINGTLGVGTELPTATLHVKRSDNTSRLLVEESGSGGNQALLHLKKTINAPFQRYESQFGLWDFSAGFFFVINDPADAAIEMTVEKDGDMTIGGTLTENSSRATKHKIEAIDPRAVLAKVLALPVSKWTYKEDDAQARHVGPMAEDFYAAFGLGATDKGISSIDSGGVALAAIQGLKEKTDVQLQRLKVENDAQLAQKDREIAKLEIESDTQLEKLRAKTDADMAQRDRQIAALQKEKDTQFAALQAELARLKGLVERLLAKN